MLIRFIVDASTSDTSFSLDRPRKIKLFVHIILPLAPTSKTILSYREDCRFVKMFLFPVICCEHLLSKFYLSSLTFLIDAKALRFVDFSTCSANLVRTIF